MNTRLVSKPFVFILAIALLAGALVLTAGVNAQTPQPETPAEAAAPESPDAPSSLLFSYQGYLEDSGGNPVTGSVPMTFKFYDAPSGGTACWTETHSAVDVQEGIFNVLLGQITAMDTNCLTGDVYLELVVDGETLTPREVMASGWTTWEAETLPDGARTGGTLTVSNNLMTDDPNSDNLNIVGQFDPICCGNSQIPPNAFRGFTAIWDSDLAMFGLRDYGDNRKDIVINNEEAGDNIRFQIAGTDVMIATGNGNVGIGTTTPSTTLEVNGSMRVVGPKFYFGGWDFVMDEVPGRGGGRALVNGSNDMLVINYAGDFAGGVRIDSDLSMNGHGINNCGGIVEANLQTPEEVEAGHIDRFELGDVLCMSGETEQLEKCAAANTRAVVAVASVDGLPFVFGAEQIKVLGPVQVGDLLVASDVPGYAMVNNDPAPGTVIAKAMQNFAGGQGLILAMIDGQ